MPTGFLHCQRQSLIEIGTVRDAKHVENAGSLCRSTEHGGSIHEPQTASRRREPPVECPQADAGKPGGSQQMDVDPSETTTMKPVRREEVHCLLVGNLGASRQIRQHDADAAKECDPRRHISAPLLFVPAYEFADFRNQISRHFHESTGFVFVLRLELVMVEHALDTLLVPATRELALFHGCMMRVRRR